MDDAVQKYIDAIAPEHRPLFDRIDRLVRDTFPEATLGLTYKMPTYSVGKNRLYVGSWKHGVSVYGWSQSRATDLIARHPTLRSSKGTIQLRAEDGAAITDDELRDLVRAALAR